MNQYIDLHTHSIASDSLLTPTELVRYAAEKGLAAIALTDHDTTSGLKEAMEEGERIGLEVIPGIEITTLVDGCDVHIIGLLFDPENPGLHAHIAEMAKSRARRNEQMIAQLAAAGIDICPEDMERYGDRQISKGHIAAVLIRRGYAKDLKDALDRYMRKGRVGYVRRKTPPAEVCISLIHRAGGLAFVAHINQIDLADPEHSIDICSRLLEAGADGLETKYCEYDAFWEEQAEALARRYNVLRSGGSDFHGAIKKDLDLGTGYGNLRVPLSYLDAIQEELARRRAETHI